MQGIRNNQFRKILPLLPVFLIQLPFVFSTSNIWDSSVQAMYYELGFHGGNMRFFFDSGVPLSGILFWFMGYFPAPILFIKGILFLNNILLFYLLKKGLDKLAVFSERENYILLLLAFLWPCFSMWYHIIMLPYFLALTCFVKACLVYFTQDQKATSRRYIISFLLLIAAFNIQSFLVIWLGIMASYFLLSLPKENISSYSFGFLRKHFFFLLLPFLYFFSIRFLFPLSGFYKSDNYNVINPMPWPVLKEAFMSIVNMTVTPLYQLVLFVKKDWISFLIILAVISPFGWWSFSSLRKLSSAFYASNRKWILIFLLLLGAAILPYALVGKHVSTHGYETRHSLTAHLPLAALFILTLRFFPSKLYSSLLFLTITFVFIVFLKDQILWENRYLKYLSVTENLKEEYLSDDVAFFEEADTNFGMDEYLRFYECNIMLLRANLDQGNSSSFYFTSALHLNLGPQDVLCLSENKRNYTKEFVEEFYTKYQSRKAYLFFGGFDAIPNDYSIVKIHSANKNNVEVIINYLLSGKDRKEYLKQLTSVEINSFYVKSKN